MKIEIEITEADAMTLQDIADREQGTDLQDFIAQVLSMRAEELRRQELYRDITPERRGEMLVEFFRGGFELEAAEPAN